MINLKRTNHKKNRGYETMALGGRPKEEDGHKPLKISVDNFTYNALEKIENKSKFIEQCMRPILEQFDLGEATEILKMVDEMISREIIEATKERKYDKAVALATLGNCFRDFRKLCLATKEPHQTITVGGGLTVGHGTEIARRYGQDLITKWLRVKSLK
jgi:hypothetical protein